MVVTGIARDGDVDRVLRPAERPRASLSDSRDDHEHDIDNIHDHDDYYYHHHDRGSCARDHRRTDNHRGTHNHRGTRRDGTAGDRGTHNHRRSDYDRGAHHHRTRVSGHGAGRIPDHRPDIASRHLPGNR